MTIFSGIPFTDDNPYNYREAKRVLRLALAELRKRPKLLQMLRIDPKGPGRPAITGRESDTVWDIIPLKAARDDEPFTNCLHLTLAIRRDELYAPVIVPNGLKGQYRRNLLDLSEQQFAMLFQKLSVNFHRLFGKVSGATPVIQLVQRHYRSRRSEPTVDARLNFDLRTAYPSDNKMIKNQPLWLDTVYKALTNKKGNLQLAVGVAFSYERCKEVSTRKLLDHVENSWLMCKPLVDTVFSDGKPTH